MEAPLAEVNLDMVGRLAFNRDSRLQSETLTDSVFDVIGKVNILLLL